MGRPKSEFLWDVFEKVCAMPIYKSQDEIAERMGVSKDTIERRIKERFGDDAPTFAAFIEQQQSAFRESILGAQHTTAKKGNPALLIWLGKQYLGQKDKMELSNPEGKSFTFKYKVE